LDGPLETVLMAGATDCADSGLDAASVARGERLAELATELLDAETRGPRAEAPPESCEAEDAPESLAGESAVATP
jgi:hypothetical protein